MTQRPIKFRAWDKEKKRMIYLPDGYDSSKPLVLIPTEEGWSLAESNPIKGDNKYDDYLYSWSDADVLTGRYLPLQFTGLQDKNGKEIWEGDVVRVSANDDQYLNGKVDLVAFQQGVFILPNLDVNGELLGPLVNQDYNRGHRNVEVIGNIYENPDLLK